MMVYKKVKTHIILCPQPQFHYFDDVKNTDEKILKN